MSADNGIYILQSKDGFRIAYVHAIYNLWSNNSRTAEQENINSKHLKEYFGESKVFKFEEEAWAEAGRIYKSYGVVEYGISMIVEWKDKVFPGLETSLEKTYIISAKALMETIGEQQGLDVHLMSVCIRFPNGNHEILWNICRADASSVELTFTGDKE